MKKLLLILLLILSASVCFGQQISEQEIKAKNAIFFELFGSGGIYSFNYERILENRFTLRGGASYFWDDFFGIKWILPISSSYLISFDKDSHVEVGIGNTFILEQEGLDYASGPLVGFREQDLMEGGGYFRITFTPLLHLGKKDAPVAILGGISFGASF